MIDLHVLGKKGIIKKDPTPDELKRLASGKVPFWLDLNNLDHKSLFETLSVFGIHKLVMEDCTAKNTRTKVEQFDRYNFVVVHGVRRHDHAIETAEIDIIQGKSGVISVHYHHIEAFEWLKGNQERLAHVLGKGSDFLLHALIDFEVDNYFPVLETVEDELEELEDKVIEDPKPAYLGKLFALKRELLHVRKEIAPQREVMVALARRSVPLISSNAEAYFRDVYDHLIRVTDMLDSYREAISSIVDIHISVTSNKMNEIMKVLTIITTIFIPLSFIAGIYGMNFDIMPELRWENGYFLVLGIMAVVAGAMVVYFRKKGWM